MPECLKGHLYGICVWGLQRVLMMKGKTTVWKAFIAVSLIALLTFTCGCIGQEQTTKNRTKVVTDIAGREVVIPENIDVIVTDGAVPVLNSFMHVMGQGDKIAYSMPGLSKYQSVVAPSLKDKPTIQGSIDLEELVKLNPDVVFTASMANVQAFEERGLTVVYLPMPETDAELVGDVVRILGEVFDEQERGERYLSYFDETVARPGEIVASIPDDQRLKVLYCDYKTMTAHHRWWIEEAGGISVSKNNIAKRTTFDLEKLIAWDPDVIFVRGHDIDLVYDDARLSGISAVKNGKVYATPSGTGPWGYSSEQPLMVLLTAKMLYPEQFEDIDMEAETIAFFKEFYNCDITREQAAEILGGTA